MWLCWTTGQRSRSVVTQSRSITSSNQYRQRRRSTFMSENARPYLSSFPLTNSLFFPAISTASHALTYYSGHPLLPPSSSPLLIPLPSLIFFRLQGLSECCKILQPELGRQMAFYAWESWHNRKCVLTDRSTVIGSARCVCHIGPTVISLLAGNKTQKHSTCLGHGHIGPINPTMCEAKGLLAGGLRATPPSRIRGHSRANPKDLRAFSIPRSASPGTVYYIINSLWRFLLISDKYPPEGSLQGAARQLWTKASWLKKDWTGRTIDSSTDRCYAIR